MNGIVTALLLSLVITLITELILAVLLGVRGIDLVVIGLANCVTNPIVNYCYDWALVLSDGNLLISSICLFLLEAFAVICEALLFRALLRYRSGNAENCELDKQGRMVIPPFLKEEARIEKELITIGVLDHLEVWAKEVYDEAKTGGLMKSEDFVGISGKFPI